MRKLTAKGALDSLRRRLAERIDRSAGPDACWPFSGCESLRYGAIGYRGKRIKSNRAVWFVTFGEIPKGLCVLHRCDNMRCCNPRHLFLGTDIENVQDRDTKGRGCRGERVNTSRLTRGIVCKVRALLRKKVPVTEICKMLQFKVSSTTIYHIKNGKTWKWFKSKEAV